MTPKSLQSRLKIAKNAKFGSTVSSSKRGDNPAIPAGYTYFGQFVDHDITFDPTSSLDRTNDPNLLTNFRSPRFDLDSLYGRGPSVDQHLYDKNRAAKDGYSGYLLVGKAENGIEDDLQRNIQNRALIGDPRNDENVLVSQVQLTFIKFHNKVMDNLLDLGMPHNDETFTEGQRIVRWHYQWVVIHDFVKRLSDPEIFAAICPTPENPSKPRLRFYNPKLQPFMPVEFSGAAYRLGHSMVRSEYALNDQLEGFVGKIPIFLPNDELTPEERSGAVANRKDLRGDGKLPGLWSLQWNRFLEFDTYTRGAQNPQLSRRLDTRLAFRLGLIPAGPGGQNPLAGLNLRRGW
ncbi:hypothetical protein KFU94_31520 [Chloroflexi bacterium TSY]|nr:hypothetical protein [Chloroflexi bacterium TSY]